MEMRSNKGTQRIQVLFPEEEYAALEAHARETGRPLSQIVRECVQAYLLPEIEGKRRAAALAWFCAGEDPVDDWEHLKKGLAADLPDPAAQRGGDGR